MPSSAETLRCSSPRAVSRQIPIYLMPGATLPLDVFARRAMRCSGGTDCRVVDSDCALVAAPRPTETIPSIASKARYAISWCPRFLLPRPPRGSHRRYRFPIEMRRRGVRMIGVTSACPTSFSKS